MSVGPMPLWISDAGRYMACYALSPRVGCACKGRSVAAGGGGGRRRIRGGTRLVPDAPPKPSFDTVRPPGGPAAQPTARQPTPDRPHPTDGASDTGPHLRPTVRPTRCPTARPSGRPPTRPTARPTRQQPGATASDEPALGPRHRIHDRSGRHARHVPGHDALLEGGGLVGATARSPLSGIATLASPLEVSQASLTIFP